MDFTEVFKARKSVRKYSDLPVDDATVLRCLEAARLAPSWRNMQCWHFIVVRDRNTIDKLSSLINLWLKTVPVVIVACADPSRSGSHNGQQYYLVDTAVAMEHLVLAATNEGLGTCWIGGFDEKKVRATLGIPEKIRIVAMTPLGHPADGEGLFSKTIKRALGQKKQLTEIVHYEKW